MWNISQLSNSRCDYKIEIVNDNTVLLITRLIRDGSNTLSHKSVLDYGHIHNSAYFEVTLESSLRSLFWLYREKYVKKCLYTDFDGGVIHEGDILSHATGETFTVFYDETRETEPEKWRAVYPDGESLWLGNQVGDKGMARKVKSKWDLYDE
jgi:hypothetical protein